MGIWDRKVLTSHLTLLLQSYNILALQYVVGERNIHVYVSIQDSNMWLSNHEEATGLDPPSINQSIKLIQYINFNLLEFTTSFVSIYQYDHIAINFRIAICIILLYIKGITKIWCNTFINFLFCTSNYFINF